MRELAPVLDGEAVALDTGDQALVASGRRIGDALYVFAVNRSAGSKRLSLALPERYAAAADALGGAAPTYAGEATLEVDLGAYGVRVVVLYRCTGGSGG